jgi:PAS domain S-box-containing protein
VVEHGAGEGGSTAVQPLLARLVPWAAVPVPLLLAAIAVLWFLDLDRSFESRSLLAILNFTLVTCTSAVIALVAGRTFLATGTPGALFLGDGVLVMGTAFLVAPLAGLNAPNVTATVHNLGMLAAGALSLVGACLSYRPREPVRAPAPTVFAAYAGAAVFVGGTAYLALNGLTPTFFVQGVGGTPLRQIVLASGVGLFWAAGLVLVLAHGNATTFRRWYALGLVLLGVGLLGVMFQESLGSPISWAGRISQYLGSVYLLVASLASATEARRWALPLEAELREEREQARQLREAKERLARVLEGSNDGHWEWDIPTGRADFSDRWAEILGYRRSELAPDLSTWQGMVHPDDREEARRSQKRIARGEMDRYEVDRRLRHKDGHWVWVHVRGKVVERDADGQPVRMAGTYTDISARKASEEALAASEARFRAIAEHSPVGVFQTNATGDVVYANERGVGLTGLTRDAVMRGDWRRAVHPEDRERLLREREDGGFAGGVRTSEWRFLRPNGRIGFVRGYRSPLRDEAGRVTGYVSVVVDVTEARMLREQLTVSARLAALGTLVAGLAHEINNPLAAEMAGQGLALEVARAARQQLLTGAPIDAAKNVRELDDVVDALEDAQEAGQRVAKIVRDMAAFARPESKRSVIRLREAVDQGLRWMTTPAAGAPRIQVEDHGAPEVMGSAGQLAQVVQNLVANALKASPPGDDGVVTVRLGTDPSGQATLEVSDRGIGIAPELLTRVFEPFFTTRRAGEGRGTGLGLAICHSIVTAHNGTLTVESVVGEGSTFRVTLPAAEARTVEG